MYDTAPQAEGALVPAGIAGTSGGEIVQVPASGIAEVPASGRGSREAALPALAPGASPEAKI
eukprot:839307-Pyramimonas_sp.AAC.1